MGVASEIRYQRMLRAQIDRQIADSRLFKITYSLPVRVLSKVVHDGLVIQTRNYTIGKYHDEKYSYAIFDKRLLVLSSNRVEFLAHEFFELNPSAEVFSAIQQSLSNWEGNDFACGKMS
jgi:hypothetical protein